MRNVIILNLHQPHGKRRIPVYILNLYHAPRLERGRDALALGGGRPAICLRSTGVSARPRFPAGIPDCEQSHCPLLILSQKGVDSERAHFTTRRSL